MSAPVQGPRDVSGNHIGPGSTINQGDVHYHLPHRPAKPRAAVRIIPYPRNTDIVSRPDLIDRLDALLPDGEEHHGAALWGLGGSGKTQIALDYAYRRFDAQTCSVFWVHADSKATFTHDYKTIAAKLGIDTSLGGDKLLQRVRREIEDQPSWVLVIDNADDLSLFGVDCTAEAGKSLQEYLPQGHNGTVLWTSRDRKIANVVGPRRAIEVSKMTPDQGTALLAELSNEEIASGTGRSEEANLLLEELQWLPLAISQAAAYMQHTSTSTGQYLSLLREGRQRWKILEKNQFDRHRRPEAPNGVLEAWSISIRRIRKESPMAYRILHTIAYLDNQSIPLAVMQAASRCDDVVEAREAIARLMDFSFVGSRRAEDDSDPSYEMHKLVQEAIRYTLKIKSAAMMEDRKASEPEQTPNEALYMKRALQVASRLFPRQAPDNWGECDRYLAHAVQVSQWAEISSTQVHTAGLLRRVCNFLKARGRWREMEPMAQRALALRQESQGDRHPDTFQSVVTLARAYHGQGRYDKAEEIRANLLELGREIFGERHPETIKVMCSLAETYHGQGRFDKAEELTVTVLHLQREIIGERHPDTIRSMVGLSATYQDQYKFDKAEEILVKVLEYQRETCGEEDLEAIGTMYGLAGAYHGQGLYDKAEEMMSTVLDLRRKILGEQHPHTLRAMRGLAIIIHTMDQHEEANSLMEECLTWQRRLLGNNHPDAVDSARRLEHWNRSTTSS